MFSSFNTASQIPADHRADRIISSTLVQENNISDSTNNNCHVCSQQQFAHHAFQPGFDVTNCGYKRHRQNKKDELQHTALTNQDALADIGRPPMSITTRDRPAHALPLGSVDMEGCKVVTASELNDCDGTMYAQADQDIGYQNNCDDYNLASMYTITGLIQLTRNHYDFSSNVEAATKVRKTAVSSSSLSNNDLLTMKKTKRMTQDIFTANLKDEKLGEDDENNSEGLSSWTPSMSSFNHLNYYDRKSNDMDKDNRSDGQSNGGKAEESSGTSSYLDSNASSVEKGDNVEDSQMKVDDDYHRKRSESTDFDGPYAVIG
jgi:hypothetical protein